jgi:hypothetical protein
MTVEQGHRVSDLKPVSSPPKKPGSNRPKELQLFHALDGEPAVPEPRLFDAVPWPQGNVSHVDDLLSQCGGELKECPLERRRLQSGRRGY